MYAEQQNDAVQEGDERLFVRFYMGALKDEEKSLEAGHPVYNDVPFIKIIVPGDRNTVIDTIADARYKARFAKLWKQFEEGAKQEQPGFPLREWPAITRAAVEELAYINVHTVEQLAGLADVHGSRVMGFFDLKRKAEAFLVVAKESAGAQQLAAQNAALQDQITALKTQLDEQAKMFQKLEGQNVNQRNGSVGSPDRSK